MKSRSVLSLALLGLLLCSSAFAASEESSESTTVVVSEESSEASSGASEESSASTTTTKFPASALENSEESSTESSTEESSEEASESCECQEQKNECCEQRVEQVSPVSESQASAPKENAPSVDDSLEGIDKWLVAFKKRTMADGGIEGAASAVIEPLIKKIRRQQEHTRERLARSDEQVLEHIRREGVRHISNIIQREQVKENSQSEESSAKKPPVAQAVLDKISQLLSKKKGENSEASEASEESSESSA